ncbi:hypothetical protein LCGC14_1697160 [marine sediment metagenome]|uniref:Uncharacterized protein n=1 Tax=marine sediment metagenome TaxID=412755 RepID=A0A0F9I6P3_9ZZZZ
MKKFLELFVGGVRHVQCLDCADHEHITKMIKAGTARVGALTSAVSFTPRTRQACERCRATALLRST